MSTDKTLTAFQVEPVTEPLARALAVAMLLAESQSIDASSREVAAVLVDLISSARAELLSMTDEACHE